MILAQSFGLPAVITALASLNDIPDDAVIRFEPGVDNTRRGAPPRGRLGRRATGAMSAAALAWSAGTDWSVIAHETARSTSGRSVRRDERRRYCTPSSGLKICANARVMYVAHE